MILRVVVVARGRALRNRLAQLVSGDDVLLIPAPSIRSILTTPEAQTCDFIVASAKDVGEPPEDQLVAIHALIDRPEVVLISEIEDPSEEARLLAAGAMAVLSGSLSEQELASALRSLLQRRRERVPAARETRDHQLEPRPRSVVMVELLTLADRVATGESSVLILGETGVGKEWLARRVHSSSRRTGGPFVPVNCAAIPEGLVESELFGHMKGAFTGAIRSKRGLFEIADGGTLFLDEVGDLSPAVQVKLLRVLQDRTIQPVGGERAIRVDVKIIAATNRDLDRDVGEGIFRRDLFYRLAVITLNVPPLRERVEDLPDLITFYVRHFASQLGRPPPTLAPEVLDTFRRHDWPGNIRELANAIERAVLLCQGSSIGLHDLPSAVWAQDAAAALQKPKEHGQTPQATPRVPFLVARDEVMKRFEVSYLTRLLQETGGRVGEAARKAGVSPRSLYGRMKLHGLRKEDFKA